MSVEAGVFGALRGLVADRVYPDIAPEGVALPYITYQQVGGRAVEFVEGGPVGIRNARLQVNVWSERRVTTSALSNAAEDALRNIKASPIGAAVSEYESALKQYGARQDFSLWY